jgi:hypothetical protein
LQRQVKKADEDIALLKTINNEMADNLMKHEQESQLAHQKLTLMKNQILEYDKHVGMSKKFGAVKHAKLKYSPVTLSFMEQKEAKEVAVAAGR